jgi:hypothetical protein
MPTTNDDAIIDLELEQAHAQLLIELAAAENGRRLYLLSSDLPTDEPE